MEALQRKGIDIDTRRSHNGADTTREADDRYKQLRRIAQDAAKQKNSSWDDTRERYFRGRALQMEPPPSLYYLPPACGAEAFVPSLRTRPGILAEIVDPIRERVIAAQVTPLERDCSRRHGDRLTFGPYSGGVVVVADKGKGDKLLVAEGVETVASAHELTGLAAWAALSNTNLPNVPIPPQSEIIIAADHDKPGLKWARKAARRFVREGKTVRIAVPERERDDWNDALRRAKTDKERQALRRAILEAPLFDPDAADEQEQVDDGDRPVIEVVGGNLPQCITAAEAALRAYSKWPVYQRAGSLVITLRLPALETENGIRRAEGSRIIKTLSSDRLREMLTDAATWERYDRRSKEMVPMNCPVEVAKGLLERGEWKFPLLRGLISAPTLREDGTVLHRQGYDPATGLFLDTDGVDFPRILSKSNRGEAKDALSILEDALAEFPFVTDEDTSIALAGILTAVIRPSLDMAPMIAFTAPTPGTGKTVLARVTAIIATGSEPALATFPRSEDEMRKLIISLLRAGDQFILFDNLDRALASSALAKVITSPLHGDRLLGVLESLKLPNGAVFAATGNNLRVRGDMVRRVMRCELDTGEEHPEQRRFKRDIIRYVTKHRPKLVVAALTVLRAYALAPEDERQRLTPCGFDEWSSRVREALVWLGAADPWGRRERVEADDDDRTARTMLLSAWHRKFGDERVSIGELMKAAKPESDLHEALSLLVAARRGGEKPESLNTSAVMWVLHALNKRPTGGLKLERRKQQTSNTFRYWVEKT